VHFCLYAAINGSTVVFISSIVIFTLIFHLSSFLCGISLTALQTEVVLFCCVVVVVVSCCVPNCFFLSSYRRVAPLVYNRLFPTDVRLSAKPALLNQITLVATYITRQAVHDFVSPKSVYSELFLFLGYRIPRSHTPVFTRLLHYRLIV